jgi:hypothetical protein
VNEAYDFFGDRVVSDRELLDICFLMIIRIIDPLAREFIDSRKSAWAQHPEIKTLGELEKKALWLPRHSKTESRNRIP